MAKQVPIPANVASAYPKITQQAWNALTPADRGKLEIGLPPSSSGRGILGDILGGVESVGKQLVQGAEALPGQIEQLPAEAKKLTGSAAGTAFLSGLPGGAKPAAKTAKKSATSTTQSSQQVQTLEQQIEAQQAWATMGQQLAGDLSSYQQPVENALSGGLTAPIAAQADKSFLSAVGATPGSPASKWLNSENALSNQMDAPLQAAMASYGAAYSQGAGNVDKAIAASGAANAEAIATAPEATWLSGLGQHVLSNINYYGTLSKGIGNTLNDAVLYYANLSGAGGVGATTGPGVQETLGSIPTSSQYDPASAGTVKGSTAQALPSITSSAPAATALPIGATSVPSTP
jgi:hypothetical protein